MGQTVPYPDCCDSRECFAIGYIHGGFRVCNVLIETYKEDGQCPFCKKRREDRNDVREDRNQSCA